MKSQKRRTSSSNKSSSSANVIGGQTSSSNKSSASAEIIGGNYDLLSEILIFLPAKSLIRFKLVSKQWRSLISDDSFCRLHLLNHRRRPEPQHSFIIGLNCVKSQYFICNPTVKKLVLFRFQYTVKILQSCNGLFLLQYDLGYCVFNPTTMKYRDLNISGINIALCLLFDPSKSHHYRVVRFNGDGLYVHFSIYDSATHVWTNGGISMDSRHKFSGGVCFNNRAYFIRYHNSSFYYSPEEKNMCSIPSSPNNKHYGRRIKNYVMESNGHLHYVRLSLMVEKPSLDVYEMIDDEWVLCESADHHQLKASLGDMRFTNVELLGMIRGERVEDSVFLVHVPGQILIYRFDDNVYEVLDDFRSHYFFQEDELQFKFKDAHTFIDSLVPV